LPGIYEYPVYFFKKKIRMEKPKFEDVYDFQNLFNAYKTGITNIATYKRYRKHVTDFTVNLEENLIELQNDLIWRTYKLGDFFTFCVFEPKKREIAALPFRDRVVQIALCNVIEPYIDARFINESFACRKGKGTMHAARRAAYYIHKPENTKFIKGDIHKFFYSVDLNILMQIIRRYIDDEGILWLIEKIIRKDNPEKGIKIGNRLSQLAANIYLHELDFYVKQQLHIKYYVRYMDDFLIFSGNKHKLRVYLEQIETFLHETLHLDLNEKTCISSCKNGVDFVGFRIFPNYMIVKKKSLIRTKNILRRWKSGKISDEAFAASIGSRCGHCTGSVSYKFYNDILLQALFHALKREK